MLIDSYYQQGLKPLRTLSFYRQFSFSASRLSYFFLGHSTISYHVSEPTYTYSRHKSSSDCENPPLYIKKGMSLLILLTVIQTAKNIILWPQMVTELTIIITISVEFRFYKSVKMLLNQRSSHNLTRRAPPRQGGGREFEPLRGYKKRESQILIYQEIAAFYFVLNLLKD